MQRFSVPVSVFSFLALVENEEVDLLLQSVYLLLWMKYGARARKAT